jgi:DNA-binding NarL/FixJ family response regulator
MRNIQALPIIEIAYNLAETDQQTMRNLAAAVAAMVPRSPLAVAWFEPDAQLDVSSVHFECANLDYISQFFECQRLVPTQVRRLALSLPPRVVGLSSGDDRHLPASLEVAVCRPFSVCVMANTGDGGGLHIMFGNSNPVTWQHVQLHCFHDIALHLATALRLRRALSIATLQRNGVSCPAAMTITARDVLRRAVLAHDRATIEHGTSETQALWPAIAAGRWSLLDVFMAGKTRYIAVHRNPDTGSTLRAMSQRERSVLELVLDGYAGKRIALELGLCESTVARCLRMALRKVGVADPTGLIGVRNAVFERVTGVSAGVELAVARVAPTMTSPHLSDAERAVVMAVQGGLRTAAIARERGTSPRTVAHQLANVYRKLGISSRREVLALPTNTATPPRDSPP